MGKEYLNVKTFTSENFASFLETLSSYVLPDPGEGQRWQFAFTVTKNGRYVAIFYQTNFFLG